MCSKDEEIHVHTNHTLGDVVMLFEPFFDIAQVVIVPCSRSNTSFPVVFNNICGFFNRKCVQVKDITH